MQFWVGAFLGATCLFVGQNAVENAGLVLNKVLAFLGFLTQPVGAWVVTFGLLVYIFIKANAA